MKFLKRDFEKHLNQKKSKDFTNRQGIPFFEGEFDLSDHVLNLTGEGVFGLDPEGRIMFANKKAVKTLGYPLKEMLGLHKSDLIHAPKHQGRGNIRSKCKISQALARGKVYTVKNEVFWNKNGAAIPVQYSVGPLKGKNGETLGAVVAFRDIGDEIKKEEKRRKDEENLNVLIEYGTDIVLLEDSKSKISFVSPSLKTHLGFEVKKFIGKKGSDLMHPKDKKDVYPVWRECIFKKKLPSRVKFRLRHKEGHFVWFEAICTPVLNGRGKVKKIISVLRNISERMELEEKLRLITNYSSDIIALREPSGKILYLSPSAKRQLGLTPENEIGKMGFKYIHPDQRKEFEQGWTNTVIRQGKTFTLDIRLKNSEGKYEWFESVSDPVFDENGKVSAVVSTTRNITHYKKAESLVLQFGRIIENSLNEIYVIDAETLKFKLVNRGARMNLGFSKAELENLNPWEIKSDYNKKSFIDLIKPLLEYKKEQIYLETRHQRKDGSHYDVEIYLQLSETGSQPVLVAIAEDVTEKKITQKKLHQSNKMEAVGNLTGGVAHDFNNFLTAIQGNLQLLQYFEKNLAKESRECLEAALKSTKRGAELTNKLLAFSRKQLLKPKVFDVKERIEEFVLLLKRTIPPTIVIETHLMDGAAAINVDESLFESALLNLTLNARDAMPKGGKLIFEVEEKTLNRSAAEFGDLKPGPYIIISISDTGEGIPLEIREKIFDPFFTTKDLGKGTGLGLSMVYGFVKQSNGHIKVHSKEGKGTTFTMYFKKVGGKKEKKGKVLPETSQGRGAGETILLVEDDESVRNFISKALLSQGFKVQKAGTGPEAKRKIQEAGQIDLLITDVVLPEGINGIEVGKFFAKTFPQSPIIFSSGYTEGGGLKKTTLPKGARLLAKPYDIEELFDRVRKSLACE